MVAMYRPRLASFARFEMNPANRGDSSISPNVQTSRARVANPRVFPHGNMPKPNPTNRAPIPIGRSGLVCCNLCTSNISKATMMIGFNANKVPSMALDIP